MSYLFDVIPQIKLPEKANNPIIGELLSNYTYGNDWNLSFDSDGNCITVGNPEKAECDDAEYVINITDGGVYIGGCDFQSTMRGFVTFLEKISYDEKDNRFYADNCFEKGKPCIEFRCVHLCAFPETDLHFLKKCVRSCAVVKYSHIIIEFWGMLKYDCMKELSWPFAFSKDEIREIVKEANALGVEIIPMFNHLGHASSCRECNGKHVVLDQNPRYEYMFNSHGWVWDITREDVQQLHRKIREELIEVCGEGSYFHVGFDEAYSYGKNEDGAYEMCKYLNSLSEELKAQGRRIMIWHDMMLSKEEFKGYVATADKKVSDIIIKNLSRDIIIGDWQYWVDERVWKTSEKLSKEGFEVVCCPWDKLWNIKDSINTAEKYNLHGIIHTTWDTLYVGFAEMIYAGRISYDGPDNDKFYARFYAAEVARKVLPANGEYKKCGWSEKMTGPGL